MNFFKLRFLFWLGIFILNTTPKVLTAAPESINKIMAIVGKISISQLDFERGEEIFKNLQKQEEQNKQRRRRNKKK